MLIVRITEEGEGIPAMLPFCQTADIKPGVRVRVEASGPDGVTLKVGDRASVLVAASLARHICFEPGI